MRLSGKDLGQELVHVLGWKQGLSEGSRVGFRGVQPSCAQCGARTGSAVSYSVCVPQCLAAPGMTAGTSASCTETLLIEKVVTSPDRNNPEEPISHHTQ